MEEFKTITGSENYEVSNFGEIRNKKTGRILKGHADKNGYYRVKIKCFGIYKSLKIHRICAIQFIENPNNYPCVNHKDGNKTNNNVSNLEWCTYSQNNTHAFANGLKSGNTGMSCGTSKLTNSDVLKIREMLANGDKTTYIATLFPVNKTAIEKIKYRQTWKHI